MDKLITFLDSNGNKLFHAPCVMLPRAGDLINFAMSATDSHKWNSEDWDDCQALSGKHWTVTRVWHDFRCMSNQSTVQSIFVVLENDI